jgi:hypothetical protein
MAKIKPIELIASMSGKVCRHGDTYFVTNRQTGRVHTGRICQPSNLPPTDKQIEVRERFTQRAQRTSAWMINNKPSSLYPKGSELYQKALEAYRAQHKIGSFFGYIASIIKEDGTVTIGNVSSGGGSGDMG